MWFEGCCTVFKEFDSRCTWVESKGQRGNQLAEGCSGLSVQALEQVRDFDNKVELREVRRDKRRQRDAEDEQVCSKHQEVSAQSKGYGLGPNRWSFVRFGQSPSDIFNVGPACTSYTRTTYGPNR
ncbi:hypothetical protein YC2023_115144 [Brassica napus]